MSFTQADVDALDAAIKRGVTEVTYANGQRVRFPSIDELIKARNLAVKELNKDLAAASGKRSGHALASFS